MKLMPMENDIVKLKTQLSKDDKKEQKEQKEQNGFTSVRFGFVTKSDNLGKAKNRNVAIHSMLKGMAGKRDHVIIQLQVKVFLFSSWPADTPVIVQPLESLTTQTRQFQAMLFIPNCPMARDLLRPCNMQVFLHPPPLMDTTHPSGYKSTQKKAIASISHAILQPYALPKICLLQGPPGTGKSSTIKAIIERLIHRGMTSGSAGKPKVLLCAPSNAGVDELLRKMIKHNKDKDNKNWQISVVRLGREDRMSPDAVPYSLDTLLRNNIENAIKKKAEYMMPSLCSALKDYNTKIKGAEDKVRHFAEIGNVEQIDKMRKDVEKFKERKKQCENSMKKADNLTLSREDEEAMKKKILLNADVICSTLNSAARPPLIDIAQRRKQPHFSCVIIDEAAQSTEFDCLIPLQYYCSKLVLVGDPKQLPATIKSKKAQELGLGQSLFERLYEFLQNPLFENPVQLLDTQYRMHTEIVAFPNKHVYDGRLKTDPKVANQRASSFFQYKPYLLIDIKYAQEEQRGTSAVNFAEAEVIICIIRHINENVRANRIGVVTAYKMQKLEIKRMLRNELELVTVDTVDGFQGCEKDVIIISTVRTKGMGFLRDERRMNVALTRAKYALYVVGNFNNLKSDKNWKALITDGEERGTILSLSSRKNMKTVIPRTLTKPNPQNKAKR